MVVAGLLESRENLWMLVSRERTLRFWRRQGSHAIESLTAKHMHISTVFYSGLEGFGGLEMQNEPTPQVRFISSGWWL